MLGNGGVDEELSSGSRERVLEGGDAMVGPGLTVGLGPLLCLFYSFYFLFLFISSLWHMGKASPCSPRRPPRRRLALQTGSLAVPRLNALRTLLIGSQGRQPKIAAARQQSSKRC